ncbi:hypothetical protein BH18CHL2_BH18CHL2_01180 [soil metagenome]
MTRARLRFPQGDPIEVELSDVVGYGPEIRGFRAWLGAVAASADGRWVIHLREDELVGFRRDELKRVRLTDDGADLTLGPGSDVVHVAVADVRDFGPEPAGVRSWLGRLAHGTGEAWLRLADGRELRFKIGDGPHIAFVEVK